MPLGGRRLLDPVALWWGRACVARVQHCQMYLKASPEPPVVDVGCPCEISEPAESYCSLGPQLAGEHSQGPMHDATVTRPYRDKGDRWCVAPPLVVFCAERSLTFQHLRMPQRLTNDVRRAQYTLRNTAGHRLDYHCNGTPPIVF